MDSRLSQQFLAQLSVLSKDSPRLRHHYNLHNDYNDPCQRLFNVIEPNSYIRPHKHMGLNSTETLIAVRGAFALVTFDDVGYVDKVFKFSACHSELFGVEVPCDTWHMLIALEEASTIFEVKAGPFDPQEEKMFAGWAPEENSLEARKFLCSIYKLI